MKNISPDHTSYLTALSEAETRIEEMEDFLRIVSNWKNSYPESVFQPIENDTYIKMCEDAGISVDRVSAHVLRTVVNGYSEAAAKLLRKLEEPQ